MDFRQRYGPWAIVAGASEGTGREFARQIAAQGVPCFLIARREAPLRALADTIETESGIRCEIATIDLAAPDAIDALIRAVGDREVGLYIANAGADPHGQRFHDLPVEAWLDLVQRNVMMTVRACHHFGGRMLTRGHGGLLLVNSGACYGTASRLAIYSGTKAFEYAFAESLWAELSPQGIDVLSLVLGQTDTPAYRAFLADKGVPFPDHVADPADVARIGLERLRHGPIHNWGLADEEAGFAPMSAAARRARVLAIDAASARLFGDAA